MAIIGRMGQELPEKSREHVNFRCGCGARFSGPPGRVEDAPDQGWHPFRYFAACPECGEEAPQAAWERALMKAWRRATGPRTPEGKARSAANLEGHPTPEEAQITRFNAMKHGMFAKTAKFFPAKPGKYPQCDGCEHLDGDDPRGSECVRHRACLKQVELFMRYQSAFDSRDPELLLELQASRHAAIQALIDSMILAIAQDGGPRIKTVEWYYDKDGGFHLAQWVDERGEVHQIYELKEHPLLKPLIDYINKNSMTLADLGMTPKVQDDQDLMRGFLDHEREGRDSAEGFRRSIEEQQRKLLELVEGSYEDQDAIDITDRAEVVRDG